MRVTVLFYFVVILVISESRFLLKVSEKLTNVTSTFFVPFSYEGLWNEIELKQSFWHKITLSFITKREQNLLIHGP